MNGVILIEIDGDDLDTIASYLEKQFVEHKGTLGFGKELLRR